MNLFSVQVHKPNWQLLGSCEELTGDRTNRVYTDYEKILLKLNLTEKLRERLCFMWVVWPGFCMQRWDGFSVTVFCEASSKIYSFKFPCHSVAQIIPLQYLYSVARSTCSRVFLLQTVLKYFEWYYLLFLISFIFNRPMLRVWWMLFSEL